MTLSRVLDWILLHSAGHPGIETQGPFWDKSKMKTTKILGAVLTLFLLTAFFISSGAAAPAAGSTVYVYEYGIGAPSDTYYLWVNGSLAGSVTLDSTGTLTGEGITEGIYSTTTAGTTLFTVKYPRTTLNAYKSGTGTSIDGTTVFRTQLVDFVVSGTDDLAYGLRFTTPAGGTTNTFGEDSVTRAQLLFADSTIFPESQLRGINISDVEHGDWKAKVSLKTGYAQGMMIPTTPSKYLSSNTISFTVSLPPADSISVSKARIAPGSSLLLTLTGMPSSRVYINIDEPGFHVLDGQSGVLEWYNDETGYLYNFTVMLSSSGTRTLQLDTNSSSKNATYSLIATFPSSTQTAVVVVSTEKGVVTVQSLKDSYYIGNNITLSGTNTETKNIYLYIKGANVQQTYLTNATVNADGTWTKTFDPGIYRPLDAGTYTIYAAASAGPAPGYSFDSNSIYATTSIFLKQPYISAFADSSTVAQGDKIKITGNAEGADSLMYYVFGTNYFSTGSIIVEDDASYEVKVSTADLDAGQYFVVVQHPMYDRLFNIGPIPAQYGGYDIKMNANGDYASDGSMLMFNTNERQSANAAEALCQALDIQNIDDMYVKLTIIVAQHTLTMNPVSDIVKGQLLTVSGTTNLKEGTGITVDILSTAFTEDDISIVSSSSFLTQTTTVQKGVDGVNPWEVTFDTTGLNVDTYIIQAKTDDLTTSTSIIIHEEGYTVPPTPTPTLIPPPTPIPTPTNIVLSPGFTLQTVTVNPEYSPDVTEGTPIAVLAYLTIAKDAITTSESLKFSTDIRQSTFWTVDVYKGTTVNNYTSEDALITSLSSTNFAYTISGFVLDYNQPVTLVINLTGLYPAVSGNITALKIDGPYFTYYYKYGPTQSVSSFDNELELQSGWNFISVPKKLNTTIQSAENLFMEVDTDNRSVLGYDAFQKVWVSVQPDDFIQPLNAYWIYAKTPCSIALAYPDSPVLPAAKTLYPGWNAVGLSSLDKTPAQTALVGTSWRVLIPWNLEGGVYDQAIVNGGSDANSPSRFMTPGNGYWVYVDSESMLLGLTA